MGRKKAANVLILNFEEMKRFFCTPVNTIVKITGNSCKEPTMRYDGDVVKENVVWHNSSGSIALPEFFVYTPLMDHPCFTGRIDIRGENTDGALLYVKPIPRILFTLPLYSAIKYTEIGGMSNEMLQTLLEYGFYSENDFNSLEAGTKKKLLAYIKEGAGRKDDDKEISSYEKRRRIYIAATNEGYFEVKKYKCLRHEMEIQRRKILQAFYGEQKPLGKIVSEEKLAMPKDQVRKIIKRESQNMLRWLLLE